MKYTVSPLTSKAFADNGSLYPSGVPQPNNYLPGDADLQSIVTGGTFTTSGQAFVNLYVLAYGFEQGTSVVEYSQPPVYMGYLINIAISINERDPLMWFYYFNVGLTYVTIGVASAVFFFFVIKKPVLGKLWGAIIVGLVGSFLGGLIDQIFSRVIQYLSDFNSVNVFSALTTSLLMIWLLSKASYPR